VNIPVVTWCINSRPFLLADDSRPMGSSRVSSDVAAAALDFAAAHRPGLFPPTALHRVLLCACNQTLKERPTDDAHFWRAC
jgi:hypothetical protein